MTVQADLITRALSLPLADRAELARQLILSLESGEYDANAEAAWEAEIELRLAAVDRGEATLVEWRESVERIQKTLRKREPG